MFPRRSGVLLHPTSLPGPYGLGELGPHALRWLDFLAEAGQRIWQVLPLGPTGYGDSPYQSFSSFAGNPYLISLERLAEQGYLQRDDLGDDSYPAGRVDFGSVISFRLGALATAAERWQARASTAERTAFLDFRRRQRAWLDDYALFMALKEAHGGRPWNEWPEPLRLRDRQALAEARGAHGAAIERSELYQFWFEEQWQALRQAAQQRNVAIFGDVPIYVAFDSADAWTMQGLLELDAEGNPTVIAGVPPDYFAATGQRWGNPIYRWGLHAEQGFSWWVARLRRTLEHVDLLRIDHFRAFEAYWEVPSDEPTAERGRWVDGPGQAIFDVFQREFGGDGEGLLPIVAEDLGVITPAVEALRDQNNLPGMKVLQFAFGGDAHDPFLPHNYPRNAVVYTGTHDNDTTLGWYRQAPEAERDLLRRYLASSGENVAHDVWRAAQASVAHTALVPLQDLLGLGSEGRMNLPGAASGNWGWRFDWSDLPVGLAALMRSTAELYGRFGGAGPVDTAYRQTKIG
jgi:4-alpha-glucanotransferase